MTKRAVRVAISLLLAAALLAFFLWNVDFARVGEALERAHLGWLAGATALALFSYWLRAVRWQLILLPVGRVSHLGAVLATAIGYAAMTVLPARMGDVVRPLVLARHERIPVAATLASILTERIFDLWTVVVFFLVFVVWPPPMAVLGEEAKSTLHVLSLTGWAVGAGLVVGSGVLLAMFRFQESFIDRITAPIGRWLPRWQQPIASFLGHFLDGLRVLRRPRDLAVTLAASAALWGVIYWQVHVTLLAFDLDLPFRAGYLLVTLAVIGLAIPTPGGVGGFHKATQLGLTLFFAVDINLATAIAIVYHAICFVPITIIGLLCLPAAGMSLKEAEALASSKKEASP